MSTRKGGLGRGLGALIPAGESKQLSSVVAGVAVDVANLNRVPLQSIVPNPRQPRTVFDEEKMAELITSIKEVGVLQPPVVRVVADGRYELIMGERRWRAAKAAGLSEIPVIIRQTPDNELLREALLENIHRSELNALEEGAAYEQLINDFNYTHDELAQKIGRSRPHITNTLRLLALPPSVQRRVAAGVLSAGHARALLALGESAAMERLANRIVTEGLSVRAVEEIISVGVKGGKKKSSANKTKSVSPELAELAEELGDFLNTRVTIEKVTGKSNGKIIIEYASAEDLRRIIEEIEG
ncbi:MAG: ParB/RepB/Spo0J family partition protein [Actinobacteria bacterium]|nr:ParB/RepB/Spo0J family partition protein [Actinomycetota bacterium]